MTNFINSALRLPLKAVIALSEGNTVVTQTAACLRSNQPFALCDDSLENQEVTMTVWARCENREQYTKSENFDNLADLLQIPRIKLLQFFDQFGFIWLSYLRVYRLPQPIVVANTGKGKFLGFPNPIPITELQPVLDDANYQFHKKLIDSSPIDRILISLAPKSPVMNDWIGNKEVVKLGNRSIEQDTGKSNYQAGTDFENIVRKGLEFLGFTIDYDHKGGAGGLDLFCRSPYLLFGECKAGKSIPNDTAVQLLNLGTIREQKFFNTPGTVKLIIGPGRPTTQLLDAAKVHKMSVINPQSLQKLIELQSKYPGSVDLIMLRKYLVPGQADAKIEEYIEKIQKAISLRSHIIGKVRDLIKATDDSESVDLNTIYGAYVGANPPQTLTRNELQEILIELASPLIGYLGRIEQENGKKSDGFYYLRDIKNHLDHDEEKLQMSS